MYQKLPKIIIKIVLSLMALNSEVSCAEYVIPPEYDNTVLSSKSQDEVLITNKLTLLSSNSYKLGEKIVRVKCRIVPKIKCRGGKTPDIRTTLKEVPLLKDPIKLLAVNVENVISTAEDAGTSFRVCGGAMGAIRWDDSVLTQTATNTTYTYSPLNYSFTYYFFSDQTGNLYADSKNGGTVVGALDSYMVIEAKQFCK